MRKSLTAGLNTRPIRTTLDPQRLAEWLDTAAGRDLLALESERMRATLPSLIGHRLLQIGRWGFDLSLYGRSPLLQHWILGIHAGDGAHARIDCQSLPVATRSVDAVVLPHSLELARSPHRLLREVDRVLCSHGHVIITGFNPWGWWHTVQLLPWGKRRFPRGARCYSLNRVRDWLELLDFEMVAVRRFGTGFPWLLGDDRDKSHTLRQALAPFTQAYQIVARKRVVPLTPLRQRWLRTSVVTSAVLPEARVHRAS